jgi:hypothetical protein
LGAAVAMAEQAEPDKGPPVDAFIGARPTPVMACGLSGDKGPPVDAFIGARPTPVMACGLSGPIRNTIDVVVRDVEVGRNARRCRLG